MDKIEFNRIHLRHLKNISDHLNQSWYSYTALHTNDNQTVTKNETSYLEAEKVQDVVYLSLYGTACVLAIFGNSLVCKVVLKTPNMRNYTNVLLANMAISDILCALMFPSGLLLCWDSFILRAGHHACLAGKVIQLTSFQVSSVTMTVVAVDRFMLVYFPLVRPHRIVPVYAVMVGIWSVALLIIVVTSPSLAFHRYFVPHEAYIKCQVETVFALHLISGREQRFRLVLANLVHFWIPLFVISTCYGSISWKGSYKKLLQLQIIICIFLQIRKLIFFTCIVLRRNVGAMTPAQQEALLRIKWKTVKMLIAAVAVFFLCWFPFFLLNFLDFFGNPERKRPCNKTGLFFMAVLLAFTRYIF